MQLHAILSGCAMALLLSGCVVGSPGVGGGNVAPGTGAGTANRPLSEPEVATTSRTLISSALQHAETALKFADGATVLSDFLGRPPQPKSVCDPMDIDCIDSAGGGDIEVDFKSAMADVDKFLAERIVVAGQQEIGGPTEVVYRLQPAIFCKSDKKCQQFLTDVPVRLRVTSTAPGFLHASVLIMDGLTEVAQITLSDKQISLLLVLDALPGSTPGCAGHALGCIGAAAQAGAKLSLNNNDSSQFSLTQSSGRLRLTYDKTNAVQASMRVEVLTKLQVAYLFKQEKYAATLAPSVVTAVIDAVAKSVDAKVQVGEAQATAPYRIVAEEFAVCGAEDEWGYCIGPKKPTHGGSLLAELAGLTAATKVVRGQKSLVVQNFGLGPATSRLSHDGKVLATVDLNAATGRVVGATLGYLNKDQLAVDLTADLAAEAKLAAAYLADDIDFARWVRDESVTGKFTGKASRAVVSEDELHVSSGTLQLTSSVSGGMVTAAAGQCLAGKSKGLKGGGVLSLVVPTSCGAP